MKKITLSLIILLVASIGFSQNIQNNPKSNHGNKFEQLGTILPTPNNFRTASGAPGNQYWQQKADYDIDAFLNEKDGLLEGSEQIAYTNNSPDALSYLWLQLDENEHNPNNESNNFNGSKINQPVTDIELSGLDVKKQLNGYGENILSVTDATGKKLPYTINYTMMRIDLPQILKSGQQVIFKIKWNYKIPERMKIGGRGGYEYFEEDGNSLYTITQWYPRMCVYNDYGGWNNKQFTGRGEFSLAFGDFKVRMKVPADHIIGATGQCTNYAEVLTPAQLIKWQQAQTSDKPSEIVTLEEAKAKERNPDKVKFKTWNYTAENVRDFAWGSSRKFIWDAMGIKQAAKTVMCMSYYPKESYALYSKYSTKVVAHTIRTYSKYTIDYPYPSAISVEAANGMEYPMICFNYGRTEADGTYNEKTKYGMIGVIIHEVGHNFFPMIINSDERQWTWMDEGLNTFTQFLTEQEFDNNFPSNRGPANKITDYMRMSKDQLEPIMTNSENIANFGPNAYGKPATGLNILRETVMGRELFDFAFKQYATRWAFKHPTPADFFRTMEDASAVDLDWFWRGWFYTTDNVDVTLDEVKWYKVKTTQADPENKNVKVQAGDLTAKASGERAADFSKGPKEFTLINTPDNYYGEFKNRIDDNGVRLKLENQNLYEVTLKNTGGLISPVIIEWTFKDGSKEIERIPAEVWRTNEVEVKKIFVKEKEVANIVIDPNLETADINVNDNVFPKKVPENKFDQIKKGNN